MAKKKKNNAGRKALADKDKKQRIVIFVEAWKISQLTPDGTRKAAVEGVNARIVE